MLKDLLINNLTPGEVDRTGERVDGKATIIGKLGYNWIAVLDAKYRINTVMYTPKGYVPTLHGVMQTTYSKPTTGMSAAELLATVPVDFLTSEQTNYAYLGAATSSLPNLPVRHCTGISINGTTASMPNIQTLCFVWSRRDFVDEHDPTLSSYPTQGLTSWGSNSYTKAAGSSTQTYAGSAGTSYFMVDGSGRILTNEYSSGASTQIIPILEIPAYEDRTGERIDNKATIIGKLGENWIAVLDAAYRSIAQYSVSDKIVVTGGLPYTSGDYTVTANSTESHILAQTLYDIHSSKWNTCYLNQVQTATDFPAAKKCYDIIVDGNHAQLPNAQALAFVYSKKDYIDAKDPTASTNPDKKLSNWGFGSSSGYLAASTNGAGLSYCVAMNASGNLNSAFTSNKTGVYGVCPILEIPLYKDRTGERVDDKATIVGKLGNYWIAVLDATFRAFNKKFGKYETNFNLPSVADAYFITSDMTNEAAFLTQKTVDPNTSKFNTDYFKTQNTGTDQYDTIGVPAAAHCFGIQINGQNAQLGNIQSTAFVFANRSFVDANDPTAETNPRFKLSNWSFDSTLSTRVFSSTKNSPQTQQAVDKSGQIYQTAKSYYSGVVPILEIPLWCDDDYK